MGTLSYLDSDLKITSAEHHKLTKSCLDIRYQIFCRRKFRQQKFRRQKFRRQKLRRQKFLRR